MILRRYLGALFVASGVTFGLFWVMQALIGVEGSLNERALGSVVDFVRLKRESQVETKKRELPQKPDASPAPATHPDKADETGCAHARLVQRGEKTWMFNERGELLLAHLTPKGFEELGRVQLIEPTLGQLNRRDGVCWSHPAYADRHVFVRSDEELACFDLSAR